MKKKSKKVGVSAKTPPRAARVPSRGATPSGRSARSRKEIPPTVMDIYAKPGTKVTPIYKDGKPLNGYTFHQEQVAKHLPEGGVFTVESTDVGSFHTDVYLVEVSGVSFNSVCLADAPALRIGAKPKATPNKKK